MDVRSIFLFITAVIFTGVGLYICRRGPSAFGRASYGMHVLSVGLWSFSLGMFYYSESMEASLFWAKSLYLTGSVVAATFLYFSFVISSGDRGVSIHKRMFVVLPNIALFLLFFCTSFILKEVRVINGSKGFVYGAGHIVWDLVFDMQFVAAMVLLIKMYRDKACVGIREMRIKYILLATIITLLLAGTTNVFMPWFKKFDLLWAGPGFAYLWLFCILYAITRYRIMDVKIVIARLALFCLVYIPLCMTPILFIIWKREAVESIFGEQFWLVPTLSGMVIAVVGLMIYLQVQRRTEDRLKAKKLKYLEAINEFLEVVKRVRSLDKLIDFILKETTKLIGVNYASFYLVNKDTGEYVLKKSKRTKYFKGDKTAGSIKKMDSLIKYLCEVGKPIIREELKFNMTGSNSKLLKKTENEMTGMNASLIIPSFFQDELVSFIALGERKRQEPYADEDIKVFNSLGINVGLAVKNALFVDELHHTQADLIIAEKFAAIGRLAESAKHEISNPLHGMYGSFQQVLEMINDKKDSYDKLRQRAGVLVGKINDTAGELVELVSAERKEEFIELKEDLSVIDEALGSLSKRGELDKAFENELTGYEMRIKNIETRFEEIGTSLEAKDVKEKVDHVIQLLNTVIRMVIGKVRDREIVLEKDLNSAFENAKRIDKAVKAMYGLPKRIKEGEGIEIKYLIEKSFELTKHQTYWENLGSTTTEINIPEDLPKIAGSMERMETVFSGIITNAYQAMTDAGIKDMKNRVIKIRARGLSEDPNFIEVCIANNGPAIEDENLERIFAQEFTTKDKDKHRGLGLYIAKVQVEVFSGGKITARNIEGFGPEFTLKLPVWKEEEGNENDKSISA